MFDIHSCLDAKNEYACHNLSFLVNGSSMTVDQIKAATSPELSKDLRDREENMVILKKKYNMDNNEINLNQI